MRFSNYVCLVLMSTFIMVGIFLKLKINWEISLNDALLFLMACIVIALVGALVP